MSRLLLVLALVGCSKEESRPQRVDPDPAPAAKTLPVNAKTLPVNAKTPSAQVRTFDDLQVVDLDPADGALRDQATSWQLAARGRTFILETTATWCRPCIGFSKYIGDARMVAALAGVTLLRVDIDRFDEDALRSIGVSATSVPWFTIYDDGLAVRDAITSSEWDEDIPQNMAPVLAAFVKGTLVKR